MIRRCIATAMAAALVFAFSGTPVLASNASSAGSDYQATIDELNQKYDELEKQQQAINDSINRTKDEKEKQLAIKSQIDGQIISTREQISVLNDKISVLEVNIMDKQAELETQELAITKNMDMLKERMRAMYTTGNASILGLILGAEDFGEFLTRIQWAAEVAQHDRELIEGMHDDLAEINAIKAEIEDNMEQVSDSKDQLSVKQQELGVQLAQTQDEIQDIEALEQQYLANKAELDQQMAEVEAELQEIYKMIDSSGTYDGGIMLWPVAGYNTVTSDYGWRFGGTDYHTGIDIAGKNSSGQGIYGKPILAAADGTVAFTQTNYVAGRGYGIYLIIDHGGGISTLYGHTSGLAVSVGDKVTRGQTIAYVGSTGWSTGPHLHFEVRVNGAHVTPWSYLR